MTDTPTLGLPLLQAAQAQKHVTVNEALFRLDALSAAALSRREAAPPSTPADGALYIVATGAAGAWAGQGGRLAFFANGGWMFADPPLGRRVWVADEGVAVRHDGVAWIEATGGAAAGAATALRVASIDHAVVGGPASTVAAAIPDKAIVLGVTGRVTAGLGGGGAASWRLGVAGSANRYGAGYGLGAGSEAVGVTGAPVTYYGPTDLVIEGEGGDLASGAVRLCVHYLALTPPR